MLDKNTEVIILMATYNGALYIDEQLQSIVDQSYQSWRLFIRDDGSKDKTADIIAEFERADPRIFNVKDMMGSAGGAKENFSLLMKFAKNHIVTEGVFAFSDQDDVWHKDKLARMLTHITSNQKPQLIHSDLVVVDENLRMINESFMKFQNLKHQESEQLKYLITQNFVTGCTCMFNRELLELATPVPQQAVMHDWWLALCAALEGDIVYEMAPTIFYRQHSSNTVGAVGYFRQINPFNTLIYKNLYSFKMRYIEMVLQAKALEQRAQQRDLNFPTLEYLKEFIALCDAGFFTKLKLLTRFRVKRSSFIFSMLLIAFILIVPSSQQLKTKGVKS